MLKNTFLFIFPYQTVLFPSVGPRLLDPDDPEYPYPLAGHTCIFISC